MQRPGGGAPDRPRRGRCMTDQIPVLSAASQLLAELGDCDVDELAQSLYWSLHCRIHDDEFASHAEASAGAEHDDAGSTAFLESLRSEEHTSELQSRFGISYAV